MSPTFSFHFSAIVNYTVLSTGVETSVQASVFGSFGYTPRSGAAGLRSKFHSEFIEDPPYCLPSGPHQLIVPRTVQRGFLVCTLSLPFLFLVFSMTTLEVGAATALFGFAFPSCLVMLSNFSCTCWPTVCLLGNNANLDSLTIFQSG